MTLIAGASRYLAQSTLTNKIGNAAQSSNVLGETFGSVGILDVGRSGALSNGIGLSPRARALNSQALSQSNATYNTLFSSTAASSDIDSARIQILGLRAQYGYGLTDDGSLSAAGLGTEVDEEV